MFNILLYEPEIPPNTGNIARLCLATNCKLFLKRPLGFSIKDKDLKRAGLDYWHNVNITIIDSLDEIYALLPDSCFYFFSTKAKKSYFEVSYKINDVLVFGPETRGLPQNLIIDNPNTLTIPMFNKQVRSLNLATSVGIVLYEAIRQTQFS
ncbi:MAG: tRNA (cytidine(34)-2'-O)-methyltransferase [Candidatus Margulisbacteria bacterium]|nr:tRNA (cytidine(34)-2'-O)-methyltransferase [Candidatus Margulisiibacteriota bacterium]